MVALSHAHDFGTMDSFSVAEEYFLVENSMAIKGKKKERDFPFNKLILKFGRNQTWDS